MKKIDGTTYIVRTFFQPDGNETVLDRVEQFVVRNL
ncbi:MAG: transposon-encoded TnpW family protein, partial [Clostridia bacterium]|nr:transposon-encoded TnpW family protein [Clostridia bacterium]